MKHPDEPEKTSVAGSGEVEEKPDDIVATVITDVNDDVAGVLEKWTDEAWIFARAEDLEQIN